MEIASVSSRFGVPFDTCVEPCCTVDGVVKPEKGPVVLSRRVRCAARLPGTGGRRDRGCSGVADPGARSGQGDPLGACVGADRGAEIVDVPVSQMRQEIVEVIQIVLVARIKGRVADQMVDKIVAVVQEVVKLVRQERVQQWTAYCGCYSSSDFGRHRRGGEGVPTGTRATDRRTNCGSAYSTTFGGQ